MHMKRPQVLSSFVQQAGWLLLGMACQLKLTLVGQIYVGEMLAIGLFLFSLWSTRFVRWEIRILGLAIALAFVQVMSDLINATQASSMAKGVGAPLLLVITIISLSRRFRANDGSIGFFLVGSAAMLLLKAGFFPNEYQQGNAWKWGGGQASLMLGLAIASFFGWRLSKPILLTAAVFFYWWSMVNNARSMAVLSILGLVLYFLSRTAAWMRLSGILAKGVPIANLILPLILAIITVNAVAYLAFAQGWMHDFLPADVHAKFSTQALSDAGLVLAGRSESLISMRAFLDAPLFGHGSWAVDKAGYVQEYLWLRYETGASEKISYTDLELIPAHSYLMGALVWSGVMGGMFWLVLANGILRRYLQASSALPLYFHVGLVFFLWDLLFSPFGADNRWQTAIYISILFSCARPRIISIKS